MINLFALSLLILINLTYGYHEIVNELQNYVDTNSTFAALLNQTFAEQAAAANTTNNITYTEMYEFFDSYITNIDYNYTYQVFYNLIFGCEYTPTGYELIREPKSQSWLMSYMIANKQFADSFNSTIFIKQWETALNINMTQYIIPQNGFQSFNDFFARQVKPQYRPINQINNNSVITSPVDGTVTNIVYKLSKNKLFNVKNETYNLSQMLQNEYYADLFDGGTAIQIILKQNNYHRYHSSIKGTVGIIEKIAGYIFVNPYPLGDNSSYDEIYWVNNNVRGVLYINNDIFGVVGHVFVGIDVYDSVNFNVEPGQFINKGDELGYFAYGGSTALLLFQPDVIQYFSVPVGPILMGQQIAITHDNELNKL